MATKEVELDNHQANHRITSRQSADGTSQLLADEPQTGDPDETTGAAPKSVPAPAIEVHPHLAWRRQLAYDLAGDGIEFGPGCHPVALGPLVRSIEYCDAHDRDGFAELFPELAHDLEDFPHVIHYQLNFDEASFVDTIGRQSRDFVIANHCLEHLVNPIRFLNQCYQLLKPGGMLFLAIPDKRRIFDRYRTRTRLCELLDRYQKDQTTLTDQQVIDFLNQVEFPNPKLTLADPATRARVAACRKRSIHVNVWNPDDLIELCWHLNSQLNMPMEIVDGVLGGDEAVLVLRKAETPASELVWMRAINRLWSEHGDRTREVQLMTLQKQNEVLLNKLEFVYAELAFMRNQIGEVANTTQRIKSLLRRIPGGQWFERWTKRG